MTTQEVRIHLRILGGALTLVVVILVAQGFLDRMERATDEGIPYQRWVNESCLPTHPGESAVVIHDGKLHCRIYSKLGYGLAPKIVSAAVTEVPK